MMQINRKEVRLTGMAGHSAVHAPPAAFPDLWNPCWIPALKADIRAHKTKRIAFP
jgi:hypothetical protein